MYFGMKTKYFDLKWHHGHLSLGMPYLISSLAGLHLPWCTNFSLGEGKGCIIAVAAHGAPCEL